MNQNHHHLPKMKSVGHMKFIYAIICIAMSSFVTPVFANDFHINSLTKQQQQAVKSSNLWHDNCLIKLSDLRLISLSYYDFKQNRRSGQLLIHKSVAKNAVILFKKLYLQKFPFTSIDTLIKYKGNIQLAEEKNITFGFVCQQDEKNNFTASALASGKVLTINPILNPAIKYVDDKENQYVIITPSAGIFSINRSLKLKGMTESIKSVLDKNHFTSLKTEENQISWKHYIFKNKMQKQFLHRGAVAKMAKSLITTPTFTYQPLTPKNRDNLKNSGKWTEGCPVPLNRLSLLTLSYYGFDRKTHIGTLIVYDSMAPFTTALFKELYRRHYPIEKFDVDNPSETENTSAFNCRMTTGQNSYSLHAYGLAVDINVSHNPYIGVYKFKNEQMIGTLIPPSTASLKFLNRNNKQTGMNETIVKTAAKYGLIEWGGHWQDRIDYMHFQVPRPIARHLTLLDTKSAEQFIALMRKYPEEIQKMSSDTRWDELYILYPQHYITSLKKYVPLLKNKSESEVIQLIYIELASIPDI